MNPVELLEVNVHRFAREASPSDLVRVLRAVAAQMERRQLAGHLEVAEGAHALHEALHASAASDAIGRAFRRPSSRAE